MSTTVMRKPGLPHALHGHLSQAPAAFSQELENVSSAQVEEVLRWPQGVFTREHLRVLLSPAASHHLEAMARAAVSLTRQRFGNTMCLYAPLYLSNHCINRCRYCGFNAAHTGERRRLTLEEAIADAKVVAAEGFTDLLLVSGEDPDFVDLTYLTELVRNLRGLFSAIAVEIYPLDEEGYRTLFGAGVDGVTLYQETYNQATYAKYHLRGPKADFVGRLASQEAAALAGMRRLGIGALLGLQDWRYEAAALAEHASYLAQTYWRSRVSISFPRLRPAPGTSLDDPHLVSDRELVQMILALRLSFSDVGLVLSTREPPAFRDRLLALGITQMSAGSKTNPGGYTASSGSSEQFEVADTRSASEMAAVLTESGLDPVWKDWDPSFLGHL